MTPDDDRDQLLRPARKRVVDRHAGTVRSPLRDAWGRYGWLVRVGGEACVLVAKRARYDGRVSISKPALADALEREAWLLLYDFDADELRVFDPEWVRSEGAEARVESKRADDVGVYDVTPTGGIACVAFVRGERPEAVGDSRPTTLSGVER